LLANVRTAREAFVVPSRALAEFGGGRVSTHRANNGCLPLLALLAALFVLWLLIRLVKSLAE
jgi:hypothetical protein